MRTFASVSAVSAAAAASLLLAAPTALATNGDNGTVKIHDAATGEEDRRNEPHVCEFYLDAFGFDAEQNVTWKIVGWAPTGDKKSPVAEGTFTLDDEGHGRTEDMTLPDGHYKLFWNFEGENGAAKHKVFWTDCEDDSPEPPSPSETPPSSEETPSEEPEEPGEEGEPSSSASNAPGPKGGGEGGEGGGLAETGASVTGISVAAATLLGAGGYLLLRRRNASQH